MTPEEYSHFFAVIPAPVINDDQLPPGAKLLYGIISQLLNEDGYCWASNTHLMMRCHASRTTVHEWLSALQKWGHIQIEIEREAAKNQEPQRRIYSAYRGRTEKRTPGRTGKRTPGRTGKRTQNNKETKGKIQGNTPPSPKGTDSPIPDHLADLLPEHLNTPAFCNIWDRWEEHRRESGKPISATNRRKSIAYLSGFTEPEAIELVEKSIIGGYTGIAGIGGRR